MKETVLWTNSAPTSTFASQTVNLSDSMQNYKYIKIKTEYDTSQSPTASVLMSVDDVNNMTGQTIVVNLCLASHDSAGNYIRPISFSTNTSVVFGNCLPLRSTTIDNTKSIPLQVIGLK